MNETPVKHYQVWGNFLSVHLKYESLKYDNIKMPQQFSPMDKEYYTN
jgi:hypothetical protein